MKEETSLGQWLKQRRKDLDLTQKELAQKVGCAEVTIHKIEADELRPSKEMAERLALCLGVPADDRSVFARFARAGAARLMPAMAGAAAARWRAPQHPNNLPAAATPLLGREADLAAVCDRVAGGARLLTLVGPPGVGKTRLALAAAGRLLPEFEDGAFFVPLATIADPGLVADLIGRTLAAPPAGARPMAEQVKSYLREKYLLLVLDDFEQVVAAAPLVADLLAVCPWLTILATSRQPLHIRGERQYLVPPLALPPVISPDGRPRLTSADVLAYPAVALFAERGGAVCMDFAVTAENADAVVAVCRRLDGLPLAIELVAARIRLFTPQMLLEHWRGSWILSVDGLRDVPPKQKTLRSAIDWSYRLLREGEQRLLRRLGVFAGSASMEAIAAVCGFDAAAGDGALDDLTALVDTNLVQRSDTARGEPRFGLLETIRDYARERLAENGEETAVRLKHAGYYQALVAPTPEKMHGPEQAAWLDQLETEYANLAAALDWTLARDPNAERAAVALGLRMADALFWFWVRRSTLREGLARFERGAAITAAWGDALERASALCDAGGLAVQLGLGAKANAHLDAAVEMCRTLIGRHDGDGKTTGSGPPVVATLTELQRTLGRALRWRGMLAPSPDRDRAPRADLEESIAIFRRLGDAPGLAFALNALGFDAIKRGDFAAARPALMESLSLFWRAGNRWGVTQVSINMAGLAEREGNYDQLRTIIAESLSPTMARELGPFLELYATTWWLGCLAQMQRGNARVLGQFRRDLTLVRNLGYQEYLWRSLYETVLPTIAADVPVRAARLAAAAQALHEQADAPGVDRHKLDAWLLTVRARLGREAFDRAWTEGQAMTLEQAAACAPGEGE